MPPKKKKVTRSCVSGRFVTKKRIKKKPGTTVTEHYRASGKKTKPKKKKS